MITLSTTAPCVLSPNPVPAVLPPQSVFDAAYEAAQPAAVRAEWNMTYPMTAALAKSLSLAGFVIDVPIMVWGWDPFLVMNLRLSDGYPWVPNAIQPNIQVVPGVDYPGTVPYDPKSPPNGAISVSLNLLDYPPFNPPPAPPPEQTDLVGIYTGTSYQGFPMYDSAPKTDSSAIPNGGTFTDSRGTFQKMVVSSILGIPEIFWLLTQPAQS